MRSDMETLIDIKELSRQSGMSVRSIRTLMQKGIVPHIRLGYRTIKFSPSKVERALAKREVRELA
jgi:predicted DNA-binding transcriptional regulator AlpA